MLRVVSLSIELSSTINILGFTVIAPFTHYSFSATFRIGQQIFFRNHGLFG
jgi:hypothetical protein